jgi:hypothetical protein
MYIRLTPNPSSSFSPTAFRIGSSGLFTIRINLELWNLEASRTPWTGDQPVVMPLSTQNNTIMKEGRQRAELRVGFELTIPVFERAKTFYALERMASEIRHPELKLKISCM